ncbi:MAG: Ig-like domain-containing protein, partial [Spirochaetales bacterium]|nr:Ig-like domain-containing protein [Spirochaetales bacterium]
MALLLIFTGCSNPTGNPDDDPVTGDGSVTGVSLTQDTAAVATGNTVQLTAAVTTSDGANVGNVSWSSDGESVATVNADGLVTGQSAGTANITVTTDEGGFTDTCVVTVENPAPGVILNKETTSIGVGVSEQLTAEETPPIGSLVWESSNTSIVTVIDGLITGVAPGTANITVTTADSTASYLCNVTVIAENDTFTTSWQTDEYGNSGSDQIQLPLVSNGTYNFTVNWGDNTANTITVWDDPKKVHTYASVGTYTITITGTINGWSFKNDKYGGDPAKMMIISNWGNFSFGNTEGQFYNCFNLTISATDTPNLTNTTSLSEAFWGSNLVTVPSMNLWNTSSVTDMSYMFSTAWNFNGNISAWDTSNVADM